MHEGLYLEQFMEFNLSQNLTIGNLLTLIAKKESDISLSMALRHLINPALIVRESS